MRKLLLNMSPTSKKMLEFGLPLLAVYFIYILIAVVSEYCRGASILIHVYSPQLEHIVMSLTLLILFSLIADVSEKQASRKK